MQIEKNIPLPEPRGFRLGELEVGDSLFFPSERGRDCADNAAQRCQRSTGRKFTVRKVSNGWRLWRIEE